MKIAAAIAAAVTLAAAATVTVGIAVISGLAGALHAATSPAPASAAAIADIPAAMLALYQQAGADICPQMPWQIIAAIGTVETANGTSTLPGVHSGANFAGAEGPMQFEPATFAAYDQPVPPGGPTRPTFTTRQTPSTPPPGCSAPTAEPPATPKRPSSPTTTPKPT